MQLDLEVINSKIINRDSNKPNKHHNFLVLYKLPHHNNNNKQQVFLEAQQLNLLQVFLENQLLEFNHNNNKEFYLINKMHQAHLGMHNN